MGFLGQTSQDGSINLTGHGPELPGLLQGRDLSLSRVAKLPGKHGQVSGGIQNVFQSGVNGFAGGGQFIKVVGLRNIRSWAARNPCMVFSAACWLISISSI
jgi:hypothetical protein